MHFHNVSNINIFDSFFKLHGLSINAILNENESTEIKIFDSNRQEGKAILLPSDYLASNPVLGYKNIAMNEVNCAIIDLTIEEKYAMIAHEIGHIFDSSKDLTNSQLQKEITADEMACNIGLQNDLISGLMKIINSMSHSDMNEQIQKRINYRNALL